MPRFDARQATQVGLRGPVSLRVIRADDTLGIPEAKYRGAGRRQAQRLANLQERLCAEGRRSLLVILQALDTGGKDGTVSHVFRGLNPQGVHVTSFKQPTPQELEHDFLWRVRPHLPSPGMIAIFNRSHYEDVLAARVHALAPEAEIERRYGAINDFEGELAGRGTAIVKIHLLISRGEQRRRLLARLDDPTKRWKFQERDIAERALWDRYLDAYDVALSRTSTVAAPWYVVPADDKDFRNWAVTRLILDTLRELDPRYPEPNLDLAALKAEIRRT